MELPSRHVPQNKHQIYCFFQALHYYTQNTLQDYKDCLSKTHTAPLSCQRPLWQRESCSLYQQHSFHVAVQSWFSKVWCLLPWGWCKTHRHLFSVFIERGSFCLDFLQKCRSTDRICCCLLMTALWFIGLCGKQRSQVAKANSGE